MEFPLRYLIVINKSITHIKFCYVFTVCGFLILSFYSKDVRLPVQLQRVMAAEAEATREARAKVQSTLHNKYLYLVEF